MMRFEPCIIYDFGMPFPVVVSHFYIWIVLAILTLVSNFRAQTKNVFQGF